MKQRGRYGVPMQTYGSIITGGPTLARLVPHLAAEGGRSFDCRQTQVADSKRSGGMRRMAATLAPRRDTSLTAVPRFTPGLRLIHRRAPAAWRTRAGSPTSPSAHLERHAGASPGRPEGGVSALGQDKLVVLVRHTASKPRFRWSAASSSYSKRPAN
jgi:hypothetical protein